LLATIRARLIGVGVDTDAHLFASLLRPLIEVVVDLPIDDMQRRSAPVSSASA
jgi:hypothetical protein